MKTFVSTVLAAGLVAAGVQAASAADLKRPAYKAPPMPIVTAYNWTGCYVGGNVGGTWSKSNVNVPAYPANVDINNTSVIAGGHAGCNYMFSNRWVVSVEGDYAWTDLDGSAALPNSPVAGERFSVKWNSMATVRGRLGYGWDNNLIYVTGGAAWAHLDNAQYVPLAGGTKSDTFGGWTVGAGIEHAFTQNWILGVEYLYADFGKKDYTYNGPTSISHTSNTVRGRVSYKF